MLNVNDLLVFDYFIYAIKYIYLNMCFQNVLENIMSNEIMLFITNFILLYLLDL